MLLLTTGAGACGFSALRSGFAGSGFCSSRNLYQEHVTFKHMSPGGVSL